MHSSDTASSTPSTATSKPTIDLTSAGLDYNPDTDTFGQDFGLSPSFGSQVGSDGRLPPGEDDEDEDPGGAEDNVDKEEDTEVSPFQKT
jgi:hypothetical protein